MHFLNFCDQVLPDFDRSSWHPAGPRCTLNPDAADVAGLRRGGPGTAFCEVPSHGLQVDRFSETVDMSRCELGKCHGNAMEMPGSQATLQLHV